MIILKIFKQDGSPYWTENFKDQQMADGWLANEKTRDYWDPTYTWQFIDNSPTPEQIAAAQAAADATLQANIAAQAQIVQDVALLKAAIAAPTLTLVQCQKICQFLLREYVRERKL